MHKPMFSSPRFIAAALILCFLIAVSVMGQLADSGGVKITQWSGTAAQTGGVAGSVGVGGLAAEAATAAGNPVRVGGVFNTTPATLTNGQQGTLQLDSGQNLKVTFGGGLASGTNLIGTILPKTGCGTTVYDSVPTNLPSSLGVLTATATCPEAVYLQSLDTTTAHPVTFQDASTNCNSGPCNYIPPGFVLQPLASVRFPLGYVKMTGGIKWNTDAINKVTGWVEGIQ